MSSSLFRDILLNHKVCQHFSGARLCAPTHIRPRLLLEPESDAEAGVAVEFGVGNQVHDRRDLEKYIQRRILEGVRHTRNEADANTAVLILNFQPAADAEVEGQFALGDIGFVTEDGPVMMEPVHMNVEVGVATERPCRGCINRCIATEPVLERDAGGFARDDADAGAGRLGGGCECHGRENESGQDEYLFHAFLRVDEIYGEQHL